jgi:hypothetical protein
VEREPWIEGLIQSLALLADTQAQYCGWVEPCTEFFVSPQELLCMVFDDSAYTDMRPGQTFIAPDVHKLMSELDAMTKDLELDKPPETLLQSKQWQAIVEQAAKTKAAVEQATQPRQ